MNTIERIILHIIHASLRFISWTTSPLFKFWYENERKPLPRPSSPWVMKSATRVAAAIRKREVKSRDVVDGYIQHIKAINPSLNVIVAERYDRARKEADEIDRILDSKSIPDHFSPENAPFLGLPFTTKESFSVTGLPNTSGLLNLRGANGISKEDAVTVAYMRQAGAIPLCVSNISELCMWYESNNLMYGRTLNAYHQGRMVGGSSGGEGCIISAAGSVFGIGADLGGSIRMPAFFNGVFGHKPTTGMVPNKGQFPDALSKAREYVSTGPLCRYVEDLMPMFKVMAGAENRARMQLDTKVDISKLKVFYMEGDGGGWLTSPVQPEIKECIRKAAQHFRSLGCNVQPAQFKRLRRSFGMWMAKMHRSGNESFCSLMGRGSPNNMPIRPLKEFFNWCLGCPQHTLPAIGLAIAEKLPPSETQLDTLCQMADELKEEVRQALSGEAIFLYPTHPIAAPYHNQALLTLFNFGYTGIFNILGLPCTQVPMGLNKLGMPIGIQVIGDQFNDHVTIEAAEELDKAFGGWVPPFAQ